MSNDTLYEAFVPSGTEMPDYSVGLFTGDPAAIKDWVVETQPHWRTEHVRLVPKIAKHVTADLVSDLQRLKADKERVDRALSDALSKGGRP